MNIVLLIFPIRNGAMLLILSLLRLLFYDHLNMLSYDITDKSNTDKWSEEDHTCIP